MSTSRKEPTIGVLPEHEEMTPAQRQKSRGSSAPRGNSAPPVQPVIVRSKLAPLAFLLAIAGVGLAGFAYWQLSLTQKALYSAEMRIADLEGKLELSDDESSASITAMQAKLKWADSEIRKLWGVSYDTNRKAIEANKNSIASIKKTTKGVDGKIKNALKGTTAEIQLINDLIEAQQASMVSIEQNDAQRVSAIRSLTEQLAKLERSEKAIKDRVGNNEEAIKAIDAFRRTVNQQLLQLRGGAQPQ